MWKTNLKGKKQIEESRWESWLALGVIGEQVGKVGDRQLTDFRSEGKCLNFHIILHMCTFTLKMPLTVIIEFFLIFITELSSHLLLNFSPWGTHLYHILQMMTFRIKAIKSYISYSSTELRFEPRVTGSKAAILPTLTFLIHMANWKSETTTKSLCVQGST